MDHQALNFSIVFPTRDRVKLLWACLESIRDTAKHLERVEVLIAVDDDDKHTNRELPKLRSHFPFLDVLHNRRAARNFSVEYYNPLAAKSRGRFVQLLNDDVTFVTPHWDALALEHLERFTASHPDGILLGRPHDDTGCDYACFPLLSREAINALGFAQNPGFPSWGADIHLHRVFDYFRREVFLPYNLKHHCCHNKTRERDDVSKRMGRLAKYPWGVVFEDIDKLKKHITPAP